MTEVVVVCIKSTVKLRETPCIGRSKKKKKRARVIELVKNVVISGIKGGISTPAPMKEAKKDDTLCCDFVQLFMVVARFTSNGCSVVLDRLLRARGPTLHLLSVLLLSVHLDRLVMRRAIRGQCREQGFR